MNTVITLAGKEFRDGLRNRWLLAITVLFAVLAIGLSYFGAAASGTVGFTGLATTIASLASLAMFIMPLIALLLAYDSIVGEDQQGTLLLLLSYPLGRGQLLTGKLLGHGAILAVATTVGFGSAGLVITLFADSVDLAALWSALAVFIATALLLGLSFVALAYLISVTVTEKATAAGLALLVWFGFVVLFDLVLLGVLVAGEGAIGTAVLPYLLLLNPADVFRLINLTGFDAARAASGLLSIADRTLLSPGLLITALVLWVLVPYGLAIWRFRRRPL